MSNQFEAEEFFSEPPYFGVLANLLSSENEGAEAALSSSAPKVMETALEYAELAALRRLSDKQADRLGEILAIANCNELLSFWIVEIDHFVGHYLGLLNEDDRESYRDQEALLREYIGVLENFPIPTNKQIEDYLPQRQ